MTQLVADAFAADPRVAQARELLLQTLAEYQRRITGVRPPQPGLQADYDKAIEQFGLTRAGPLYYPYLGSGIGRGPLVELADGSVKYDMISGIGVHYLGHGHPALVAAAIDAAVSDVVMQGNLQQNHEIAALSQSLLALANRKSKLLEHCFITTSGAMANENALKLLFQKKHPAHRVLAFSGGFAGRTLALSQITDKASYRDGLPTTLAVDYVPFFDVNSAERSASAAMGALREHLHRYPQQHAAMWIELIQGEGGYYPGTRAFFVPLLNELRTAGIPIWIDEIQTFGRTTQPFAFQHFDLDEYVDVVTIGKLTQACATLFTDALKPRTGLISQTFTASTSAIFAARAILDLISRDGFFGADGKVACLSAHLVGRLRGISDRHPDWLRGPFGLGAMIACSVFDGSESITRSFLRALFDNGVISFVAGANPARVRFLMPIGAMTIAHIDAVSEIVEKTLSQVAVSK